MSLSNCLCYELLGVLVALVAITAALYKFAFSYWRNKGVPFLPPRIPFGNFENPARRTRSIGVWLKDFYLQCKAQGFTRHAGFYVFASPQYLPIDLDHLKNILTKDFAHFVDRGVYYNERDDPITAHLFAIGGEKWHNLRAKLTPTFTTGKMKAMFQTLVDCERHLQIMADRSYEAGKPFDIKEMLGRFTTDIIGSCAFGLECNTFEEEDSPFRVYGRRILLGSGRLGQLKASFVQTFPNAARALHMCLVPPDVAEFFTRVVKDTVAYRESQDVIRNDFLQLLLNLKNSKLAEERGYQHDGKTLSIDEIVAQCFVFFLAGFETSSTTMAFALYELSRNQEVQERARKEIKDTLERHQGQITYEAVQELKYLQQIIDETLRLYPPIPLISRVCIKDYKIPDQDVTLEKGTKVMVSILGIHHDPDIYPDPERFDPERFNDENRRSRHPYAHIPFGEGPRICIGMRFGLMQSKVGLLSLLRRFRFTVNRNTRQPLKMSPQSFVPVAEGDIWLDAEKL